MPNVNLNNNAHFEGRLTKAPVAFENKDGSHKVMMTLACRRNYPNSAGNYDSDFVEIEAFVPASVHGLGVYDKLAKGDMVGVGCSVRSSSYTGKDGKTVYKQVLQATSVALREKKSVSEARRAADAGTAANTADTIVPETTIEVPVEPLQGVTAVDPLNPPTA